VTVEGDHGAQRWRAPCGDELTRRGDELVIAAAFPIEGLTLTRYRNPVLRLGDERFTLVAVEGQRRRPTYRFRAEHPNLYAPSGELVDYDPARHHERARDRRRLLLAWLVYLPLVPLTPVIGLLPEAVRLRLRVLGVDAGRAMRLSLSIEWLLLFFALLGYLFSGGFLTLAGAVLGALCLLLVTDIAYRVASDYDSRAPGMFGVVGAFRDFVVELWRTRHGALPPSTGERREPPREPP